MLRHIRKSAELEVKEEILQRTRQFEKDNQRRRVDVERIENRMKSKERTLDNKIEQYDRRERQLMDKEAVLEERKTGFDKREADLVKALEDTRRKAEEICGMTVEEAKRVLLGQLESEVRQESAGIIRRKSKMKPGKPRQKSATNHHLRHPEVLFRAGI